MLEAIPVDLALNEGEKPPVLKCIFYAEFDSRVGPRIVHQIPENQPDQTISKETFDSLSGYFITKPELLDKFIKVNTSKLKMMGHPVVIEHKKYERNAFIFNLCFVVDNVSHVDCLYEPLVRKMAHYLVNLEIESEYLSKESTRNELKCLMKAIYDGLNERGECSITVNKTTCVNLKIMPKVYPPPKKSVSPHDAPVLRRRYVQSDLARLDVVTQKCLPHFTGFLPVSQISEVVQIDKQVVCRCVENLQFHGLALVLPLFLYSNCYAVTSHVRKFYESDERFKGDFCKFVALHEPSVAPPPKFFDVFRLLSRIQPSLTVRDWCLRHNPRVYNVDERKFVQLSVYNGLVRKLTAYPASVMTPSRRLLAAGYTNCDRSTTDDETTTTAAESTDFSAPLDGSKTVEELAMLWGQRPTETFQRLEINPEIVLLLK